MSQVNLVLNHLKSGRTITNAQAFELYHATRLSSIIFVLRKKGYNITTIQRPATNSSGGTYYYGEYRLIGENN